ncbi:hypothetical protein GCM10023334_067460 [Nonomuraea thailandensis]
MTTNLARQPLQQEQPAIGLDLPAWSEWLQQQLRTPWRTQEWDPNAWMFTADPDHPQTAMRACPTAACRNVIKGSRQRSFCQPCQKATFFWPETFTPRCGDPA